jgi:hypothetical protein
MTLAGKAAELPFSIEREEVAAQTIEARAVVIALVSRVEAALAAKAMMVRCVSVPVHVFFGLLELDAIRASS